MSKVTDFAASAALFQGLFPEVIVCDKSSYVALFDRESYKGLLRKRDKIALFRRNGDVLYSNSVCSVGNAVKDACEAIQKDSGSK